MDTPENDVDLDDMASREHHLTREDDGGLRRTTLDVGGEEDHWGQQLDHLLMKAGVSQRQLAVRAGLDPSSLSRLKNSRERPIATTTVGKIGQALEDIGVTNATKILFGVMPPPSDMGAPTAVFVDVLRLLQGFSAPQAPSVEALEGVVTAQRQRSPQRKIAYVPHDLDDDRLSDLVDELRRHSYTIIPVRSNRVQADAETYWFSPLLPDLLSAITHGVAVYVFAGFDRWLAPIAKWLTEEDKHVVIAGAPGTIPVELVLAAGTPAPLAARAAMSEGASSELSADEVAIVEHMFSPTVVPPKGFFTFEFLLSQLVQCQAHAERFDDDSARRVLSDCIKKGVVSQQSRNIGGARMIELDLTHPLVRRYFERQAQATKRG